MAAPPETRKVADAELVARAKRNAVEDWLRQSGFAAGLVAGVGAVLAIAVLEVAGVIAWGWCRLSYLCFLAFILVGCATSAACARIARFRSRHAVRELERRYGCLPLKKYVKAMRRATAPDETTVVLIGWGLPHGDHWWVCVRIAHRGRSATVETRYRPFDGSGGFAFDFGKGLNPREGFTIATAALAPEAARRLAAMLEQMRPGRVRVRSEVLDGFPLSCAVIHGSTKRVTTITCNLAGLRELASDRPHVRMVQEVFAAGYALIDGPAEKGPPTE